MSKTAILTPRSVSVGTFQSTRRTAELVQEVLDSGQISYGPKSRMFEKQFAALHGCQYGIFSNSGTSSLQVAVQAMKELHGWEDGDQIIVPATTFIATANVVKHCGLVPVFCDVEPISFGLDPEKVKALITFRTRAMIPVHLLGQPCQMTALMQIARQYDLKVIEDSCEAMFVHHYGQPVGSMGDIGCFSTYVAHLLVTGVGGMSITNNPAYAAKMRSLINHGLDLAQLNADENFSPQPMRGRRFLFTSHGHSYRGTDFQAALGLAQLEEHETMLRVRRRNAQHLYAGLQIINKHQGHPFVIPQINAGNEHAWMMAPIILRQEGNVSQDKTWLTQALNEAGIETRDLPSILGQPVYNLDETRYPVSAWLWRSGWYVGVHQALTPDDIQYVVDTLSHSL